MTGEEIVTLIIMCVVCFGCGVTFFLIGIWAERSQTPFGFWTWKKVKADSITDIPAYNRENARMWKRYCVPYFLCCIFEISSIWFAGLRWVSLGLLLGASTVGIGWLIWQYQRTLRKFSRKTD